MITLLCIQTLLRETPALPLRLHLVAAISHKLHSLIHYSRPTSVSKLVVETNQTSDRFLSTIWRIRTSREGFYLRRWLYRPFSAYGSVTWRAPHSKIVTKSGIYLYRLTTRRHAHAPRSSKNLDWPQFGLFRYSSRFTIRVKHPNPSSKTRWSKWTSSKAFRCVFSALLAWKRPLTREHLRYSNLRRLTYRRYIIYGPTREESRLYGWNVRDSSWLHQNPRSQQIND